MPVTSPDKIVRERFGFDTVFDSAGDVASTLPRPKRVFSIEEVAALKRAAFAEGEEMANASMMARQTEALEQVVQACAQALPRLAGVAHEHRSGSAQLALACGRAIAGAALDKFPEAPVLAALDALAREIESAPRLVVSAAPELASRLRETLGEATLAAGFPGAVQVRDDPVLEGQAFTLDFGDGHAAYDPQAASLRVAQAMEAALAAEGLHAEPLIPGSES
jgi:flagellar assembly protein FliH